MEEKGAREMGEIRLRTLFVTCKSQWNGDLSKHREVKIPTTSYKVSILKSLKYNSENP